MTIDLSRLAPDGDEAARRFERTRRADPFPEIPPALLNTADLVDYVVATGMVHPLTVDEDDLSEALKPASCGIRVGGTYLYWSEEKQKRGDPPECGELKHGEELVLAKNSIVYVTLEPTLRLPDYIAGRFNLTIRDVYRGLLVGTGPLVDPGFQGRLSLPLHNLTANDYTILGGEPIVWMEFTKLSPNERWSEIADKSPDRAASYVEFPRRKLDRRTVRDYVRRAHPGPIRSSIPVLVGSSVRSATKAQRAASQARALLFGLSVAAAVGIVALGLQVMGTVDDARDEIAASEKANAELRHAVEDQADQIRHLRLLINR